MRLKATVREEVQKAAQSIVVEFVGDPNRQHFEVKCSFDPYAEGIRKWDTWELKLRFEAEVFTEARTGGKSYFTHLICDRAQKHSSPFSTKRDLR